MTIPTAPVPMTPKGLFASESLELGEIYTRKDLRFLFDIKDSTLNNGVFRPKGYSSVWLFITEHKTSDRIQYEDALTGNTLHMQGQRLGRTDPLILNHREQGLELLVFYRKEKYEHLHAGFRYEGIFSYQSHSGQLPTSFVLRRDSSDAINSIPTTIEQQFSAKINFDPQDFSDSRRRIEASIVLRRGQPEFRKKLLRAYQGRCAVTGCSLQKVLEAAHIHPYLGDETNVVSNGLLLRADLHTLFDLGLWWVDPDSLRIEISEELRNSEYASIEGKPLLLPHNELEHPSRFALEFKQNSTFNN